MAQSMACEYCGHESLNHTFDVLDAATDTHLTRIGY